MLLKLYRDGMTKDGTTGKLFIDDVFECYTLEDVVRSGAKVPGQTAISAGEYKIQFNNSQRFGADWPQIMDVPNFTSIRIHGGNTTADTEGCVLVGSSRLGTQLFASQAALKPLLIKMRRAESQGEPVSIQIINGRDPLV